MPHLKSQVDLSSYNTFGIKAHARYWIEIMNEVEAREFLIDNMRNPSELFILGGGSNILIRGDLDKVVLKNNILGKELIREEGDDIYVRFGAGENWHECVMHCVENGWAGIENLSLIPGTIGAAPIQNIGAYGVELKDVFVSLEAMDIRTGILRSFNKEECKFGYRDSIFKGSAKGKYLITGVILKLSHSARLNSSYGALEVELKQMGVQDPGIKELSQAVINIRQSKLPDPKEIGNAGSFFKNPVISREAFAQIQQSYPQAPHYPQEEGVKVPAGWLIQMCGWKGKRFGTYGVHEKQALVLVNFGGADGNELYELSEKILQSVHEKFGISLIREVNVI
ncbi:MAG: UDP-N-acetylmuramate dehydrogenase [Bacteroidia bacterium]|nr:UDP-N-acetylmuramate dehydrogenase [Bacteroidia bacterium]